ncbi:MAG: hypothetical protein M1817_003818 [Caeruleum heppii]|nr:MAG: hypothetical protein M1817_003818 [Caeruleum heppii]
MAYDQGSHYRPPGRPYYAQQQPPTTERRHGQPANHDRPLAHHHSQGGYTGASQTNGDYRDPYAEHYAYQQQEQFPVQTDYFQQSNHQNSYQQPYEARNGYHGSSKPFNDAPPRPSQEPQPYLAPIPDPVAGSHSTSRSPHYGIPNGHQSGRQDVQMNRNGRSEPAMSSRSGPSSPANGRTRAAPPPAIKPEKQRPLQKQLPSPELSGWDNPFPTFPGVKKKTAKPQPDGLPQGMSSVSLQETSKPRQHSEATRQATSGDMSHLHARGYSDPPQPPSSYDTPNTSPYEEPTHDPQGQARFNNSSHPMPTPMQRPFERPKPNLDGQMYTMDSHTPQALHQRPHAGSRTTPNSPPTQPAGPDGRGYRTRSDEMIYVAPKPSDRVQPASQRLRQDYTGENNPEPSSMEYRRPQYGGQPGAPTRPRPNPRSYSEEGRQNQNTNYPPNAGVASNRPPHVKQESVGEFLDSYYGGSAASSGPRGDHYSEEMPNFDAMPPESSSHRRGMTIDQHLPAATHEPASPVPVHQAHRGRAPQALAGPPPSDSFAAQAHRSRSQPDLRSRHAAGQRPVRQAKDDTVFEMVGDLPEVPPFDAPGHAAGPWQQEYGNHPPPVRQQQAPYSRPHENPAQRPGPDPGYGQFDFGLQGYGGTGAHQPPPGPRSRVSPQAPPQVPPQGPSPGLPHDPRNRTPPVWPPRGQSGQSTGRPPPTASPQLRRSNPDALPQHPVPVRPGLMPGSMANSMSFTSQNGNGIPPTKQPPPPVRQYNNNSAPPGQQAFNPPPTVTSQGHRQSVPVTHEELNRLQQAVRTNPSDQKTQLQLAKKWVEAAVVLADEGGKVDVKTRNRNREKYIFDAHKLVKKLVHAGYADAMFYLADSYGTGRLGLEADQKEAFSLYQSAAKAGHPQAAYRTAVCCEMGQDEGGGTRRDPLKAVQWYKRAATLGDTPAMYKLGMILLNGLLGQPKNPREAVTWLKRAAERADAENPHALHELGLLYEKATGSDSIIQDQQYSKQLFLQAADLGYKFSQYRLGSAFEYGLMGCPIDPRQSIAWYSKAAQQGEHQSELALSGWYLTGSEGVLQQSDTEAYLWARKAAQAGLAKAEYAMGYFTEVGIGAPANLEDAKRWYWRAAAQNMSKARERLDDLRKGGGKMKSRERVTRSQVGRHEGDCVVM